MKGMWHSYFRILSKAAGWGGSTRVLNTSSPAELDRRLRRQSQPGNSDKLNFLLISSFIFLSPLGLYTTLLWLFSSLSPSVLYSAFPNNRA